MKVVVIIRIIGVLFLLKMIILFLDLKNFHYKLWKWIKIFLGNKTSFYSKFQETKEEEELQECPDWKHFIEEEDFEEHKLSCTKPKTILIEALHSWLLERRKMSESWTCDGTRIKKYGWAKNETTWKSHKNKAYHWEKCNFSLCHTWAITYSHDFSASELKLFSKEIKVVFHPHPLNLEYGKLIEKEARNKCLGNLMSTGWEGKGRKKLRYYYWTSCKDIIWEKWLENPQKFKITLPSLHEHKLVLYLKEVMGKEWKCILGLPKCLKKTLDHKYGNRMSFRWRECKFEICLSCIKNFI